MFVIEDELKKLPAKPGVYLMHDKSDAIIYVGKAKILKNRVKQYFQNGRNLSPKIQRMVSMVSYFEYIVVDSEVEALVLECNLIKEHRPRFNTMLMDDKGYPYIKVTVNEAYPRVMYAHAQKKDKARYFGPYPNAGAIKHVLELLRKVYSIRTCNKSLPKESGTDNRPCLYYHMGQCKAPCQGYVSQEEYGKSIDSVISFLNGNREEIKRDLKQKMQAAAENMEFEKAAEYRDLLLDVEQLKQQQKATDTNGVERDVIAYAMDGEEAVVQIFFIRGGKMLGREHFYLQHVESNGAEIIGEFIKQFYSGTPYLPKELLVSELPEDAELLAEWLSTKRGQKVRIFAPLKGSKEKLIELAQKNASIVLEQDRENLKREQARTSGAQADLAAIIGLEKVVRIESFDISNISGYSSVGSMVVFENGKKKPNDYRKFRIKTVVGPDDYASMREVLTRRFTHGMREEQELAEKGIDSELGSFTRFPDLILMDGGKGQVNIAEQVLAELGISIPVCGMVKDDNHRTRGLYCKGEELPIDTRTESFKLLTRIQDETHRFAIEYHKSLRGKAQVHSILDDIKGIGAARRRALMKYYDSLEAIKAAEPEELAKVPSMDSRAAGQVYRYFHPEVADKDREDR